MAPRGRPKFVATTAQRDRVMRLRADGWSKERIARLLGTDHETLSANFAQELEHGADIKTDALLEYAEKGAKKGNAALIKWLSDRREARRAAAQLEQRASGPETEPPAKASKLGKREQQQETANAVTGLYAPPAGPKVH